MSEDLNDLFPEPEKEPGREDEDVNLDEISKIMEEVEVEEAADGIEAEIRDIAAKFVFEMVLTLINPTPESRDRMIHGLVKMAAKRIEAGVNEQAKDMERDEAERLASLTTRGFNIAEKRFREDYESGFFDEEFLERCRKAIRKNLSR